MADLNDTMKADVAVIGLGAWGSVALWQLAARGIDVVGIERFEFGHVFGSSHGGSRMFRLACLEHPGLVPLARRSGELWAELEHTTGRRLFEPTGGLLIGPRDGHVVAGTRVAAEQYDLPVRTLDAAQLRAKYPLHASVPEHHAAVYEISAGLLRPEEAIRAAVAAATGFGARVLKNTWVSGIELRGDGVLVRMPARDLTVSQVVVTVGPWLSALVPELPAEAVRMPMTWFRPVDDPEQFTLKRFPVFIRELEGGAAIWGHGTEGNEKDIKLGLEEGNSTFEVVDADQVDRSVRAIDWKLLADILPDAVPGLGKTPSRSAVCMITRTPDKQFILGRPRGDQRLIIGGGCSGHGFKHASGIGEVLADLVVGREPRFDLSFAHPNRFL